MPTNFDFKRNSVGESGGEGEALAIKRKALFRGEKALSTFPDRPVSVPFKRSGRDSL
jgi:hypothetical protein